jgi:prevent-host-death family protein
VKSSVGVRELRQNLSQYLRRVEQGETLEVLERGKPVAVLAPLPERRGALERLMASGRVIPARLDLASLGPPPDPPPGVSLSQALSDLRSEER